MRRNGFTLVELMVVIAVMALMAGAVAVTAGGTGSGPAAAASRFASRLAAARDEAIVSGRPVSAWVAPSGYGFDRYQGSTWQAMSAKPFQGDNWQSGTVVALAGARARLRFDSLGLPDRPTSFAIARDGRTARVSVAANGDVTVE
ncbi:MAG: GspH/FimT family pseudopilin [Pseudomonadota bacterium]|nr:GspH/FimT family pseudopilin [Pseudomonadota bacterium]